MSCDVALLILQPFHHFPYVTTHPSVALPTSQLILQPIPAFYLRHRSFSNPSVASPTSQLILQPFFRFPYVTSSSPGEPPMVIGWNIMKWNWTVVRSPVLDSGGYLCANKVGSFDFFSLGFPHSPFLFHHTVSLAKTY